MSEHSPQGHMTAAAGPLARAVLVHDEILTRYNFGPAHPMGPGRARLSIELAAQLGLLAHIAIRPPARSDPELLEAVHAGGYLAALRTGADHPEFGLGTEENPVVAGQAQVAELIAGATVEAARMVWSGSTSRAVNISGGLHHAMPSSASGFCLINDAAVAITWLLEHGARRVVYLDLDAHHGDGVEKIFWDDPRVLTISIHESGLTLFPGTGFSRDIGGPSALGTAVNIPVAPDVPDEEWLQDLHAVVPPLLAVFRPQIIVSQHGADPHRADPLTHLELSMDVMSLACRSVARWADDFAGGRWVALGGGGYNRDSTARLWTHLIAAAAGVEVEPATPTPALWREQIGPGASSTMGDDGAPDLRDRFRRDRLVPDERSRALVETSRAVFPYWGLQPF